MSWSYFYGSKSSKFLGGGSTGNFMYDMYVSHCHVMVRCDGRVFTVVKAVSWRGRRGGVPVIIWRCLQTSRS